MTRRRKFAHDPTSVRAARRFALEAIGDAAAQTRETVELLVSELATNSIRHAQTDFELAVTRCAGRIRVAVTDLAGGRPTVRSPGPDEPTGRGLAIVEMLSEQWGVEHRAAANKTVWFTLSTLGG